MADKKRQSQSKSGRKGGEQSYANTHGQGVNINPMAAAAAGAIVGAAAGAVAGAVLSNDKTRKQVGDAFTTMRDRAMDTVQKVSTSTKDMQKNLPKNMDQAKQTGQKKMEEMKDKQENK